jgi:hypothetical protein
VYFYYSVLFSQRTFSVQAAPVDSKRDWVKLIFNLLKVGSVSGCFLPAVSTAKTIPSSASKKEYLQC